MSLNAKDALSRSEKNFSKITYIIDGYIASACEYGVKSVFVDVHESVYFDVQKYYTNLGFTTKCRNSNKMKISW